MTKWATPILPGSEEVVRPNGRLGIPIISKQNGCIQILPCDKAKALDLGYELVSDARKYVHIRAKAVEE
jgi:hypothetical protein